MIHPAITRATEPRPEADDSTRLERVVRGEFAYVWRLCRRLGLSEGDADDVVQQVFLIAARRLPEVGRGSERAFLRYAERRLLDALLDSMPDDLRVVFVLHEIEQQTVPEMAQALEIPLGTAASRLRRAREDFSARLARFHAKRRFDGARR